MSRRTDELQRIIESVASQEGEPTPTLSAVHKAQREVHDLLDGANEQEASAIRGDLEWLAAVEDTLRHPVG